MSGHKPVKDSGKTERTIELKISQELPLISFIRLTTNNHHNFKYFNNAQSEAETRRSCGELLVEILSKPWVETQKKRHNNFAGYESLESKKIKFEPRGYKWGNDENVSILRFGPNNKYRMIGLWEAPIFYVVGFDFDFTAYPHNHGRFS